MAGLFQVLLGDGEGGFSKAAVLDGTDDAPLIITRRDGDGDGDSIVDVICTRPFAVDFDGAGDLDIVAGNFRGGFAWFRGEGDGRFEPRSEWLLAAGEPMRVDAHSDPFVIDWDGDGDLDLLSGSSSGGVYLFDNTGSREQPEYAARQTLLAPSGHGHDAWDEEAIAGPQSSTRVWAADVDGDGKLDLLVGDRVKLMTPAAGLTVAEAKSKLVEHQQRQSAAIAEITKGGSLADDDQQRLQEVLQTFRKERGEIAVEELTGYVWLLRQR